MIPDCNASRCTASGKQIYFSAAGRRDHDLARGKRDACLADPHLGLPLECARISSIELW
jgi:hypothetical protein